ncbi:MAG: response regulator [Candidatus Sericytochromatia bacterium]
MGQKRIQFMLVEDDAVIVEGLTCYFQDRSYQGYDLELLGCSRFGMPFLDRVAAQKPDIVVVDMGLPDIHGIELAKLIRALPDPPQILFLSGRCDYLDFEQMIQAGFLGYMSKTNILQLPEALFCLYHGKPWIDPEVLQVMFDRSQKAPRKEITAYTPQPAPLSRREEIRQAITPGQRAVFDLFLKGLKPKQTALALGIKVSTVKSHLTHIRQIIGFSTLDELRDFLAE